MTKWIRWWGLAVFVGIVLLWWLCVDSIVKAVIEAAGTQVVGAKVDLESAELHLIPTSLTLTGLQVTDPDAPMSNLVEVAIINARLDTLQLFGRKVIADDMTVSGLQFNTPRTASGAITSSSLEESSRFDADGLSLGGGIPGLSLPNVDQLLAQEKAKIKKDYDAINQNIKSLEDKWKQRLDELPDKQQIDEYKQRIKKLKKGNFVEKLAGVKSLKKDIDNDRDKLKGMDRELESDLKTVESEIKRATQLPEQHANRALADLGMGENAVDDIATSIMSGQIKRWLQQAMSVLQPGDGQTTAEQTQELDHVRSEGIWVHFTQEQTVPDILVRHAQLEGLFTVSDQVIAFKGEANNLTHQPAQWHKPASFELSGQSGQNAGLAINGMLDHRSGQAKNKVDFQLTDFPLNNFGLSDSLELTLMAQKALANVSGNLSLIGENIDININSKFSDVDLQVSSDKSSAMTTVLVDTLKSVSHFDLGLALKGTPQNPTVNVVSDLNGLLSKAVGASIKKEAQALKTKLTRQLKEQLAPELQQITERGGSLAAIDEKLGLKQSELKKLAKNL